MAQKFANNATSKLAAPIDSLATQCAVTPGDGAKFPTLAAGDWFMATLVKATGQLEIVKVTARAMDMFDIVRAQENTAAIAFSAGDRIEARLTKGTLDDMVQKTAEAKASADSAQAAAGSAAAKADAAQSTADEAQSTADAALPRTGGKITGALTFNVGEPVASAGTVDLRGVTGNMVLITGTTAISAWQMLPGQALDITFASTLTLRNTTSLPGVKDIVTESGDYARIYFDGSAVRIRAYTRADGSAVQALGYRQTWQNVAGSRVPGTSYQNTTGKPIVVSVCARSTSASPDAQLVVDGVAVSQGSVTTTTDVTLQATIPPGSSYLVQTTAGASFAQIIGWAELR